MKYIKNTLILASVLSMTAACTGKFDEYNTNPNKMDMGSIGAINMFEPLVYSSASSYSSYMLSIANEISQVTVAKSIPRREHWYNLGNQDFQGLWNLGYKWANNADHMAQLAAARNETNLEAIGLTLKVYHMSFLTDMFGSIPYTDALKVNEGIRKPRVESQLEVYTAMIADLDKANSLYNHLTPFSNEDKTKDGVYGGDLVKWQKFTNTLRLRLLMRVSGRNNDLTPSVGEQIGAIVNDPATYPVFESNGDNANVRFSGAATYYRSYFTPSSFPSDTSLSSDHHIADQFLGMIYDEGAGYADPRMYFWIKPRYVITSGAVDVIRPMLGAISGSTNDYNGNSTYAEREPFLNYEVLVGDSRPGRMLNYDELLFIKAEAALNGWIGGSAQQYYEAAVTASCEMWNELSGVTSYPIMKGTKIEMTQMSITQESIDALLQSDQAKWDGTLQRLAEQKWLSLFWVNCFQQYHEMRRTGYPECKMGKGLIQLNASDGKFIARYPYTGTALATNRANYEKAFNEQGGTMADNTMMFPVWWSGQAVAQDAGTPWPHSFRTYTVAAQ